MRCDIPLDKCRTIASQIAKKRQKEGNIEAIVQKMLSIGKKIQNCIHKRKTEMEYSVQINANIDCDRGLIAISNDKCKRRRVRERELFQKRK